jgi:hypothetical protein
MTPVRTKLARARTRLEAVQRWGADPVRSDRQREIARDRARSCRELVARRQKAVDEEEGERQKLLKGDPDSRCMFLGFNRA